jgi:acyl dehydratase
VGRTFFEDVELGNRRCTDAYEVPRDEVIAYARKWDPQPWHLDEEAAAESIFGGLTACFAHVFAIQSYLVSTHGSELAVLAGLGFEDGRMMAPVRPGDRLRVMIEHLDKRPSQSKPDRGIVRSRFTVLNQHDESVMTLQGKVMVARRAAP